jgi:ribose/xylose/arabinose/galactoside ABC-type transport system permease subunit
VKSADANNAGLLLELDAILAVTLGGTSLLRRALQPARHAGSAR